MRPIFELVGLDLRETQIGDGEQQDEGEERKEEREEHATKEANKAICRVDNVERSEELLVLSAQLLQNPRTGEVLLKDRNQLED